MVRFCSVSVLSFGQHLLLVAFLPICLVAQARTRLHTFPPLQDMMLLLLPQLALILAKLVLKDFPAL